MIRPEKFHGIYSICVMKLWRVIALVLHYRNHYKHKKRFGLFLRDV